MSRAVNADASVPFVRRIGAALDDGQLRLALDRATGRFRQLRVVGLESLPDPDATRDRARAVRLATLRELDRHLERFESSLTATGGRLHWAADAKEARSIIVDLARRNAVRLAVKSKSMVSEEVGLNPALEAAGVTVVESDLGEYIIQLAGETPSHIIAPAIHKTREQVGRLLHEVLGVPLTGDPARMARVARRALRRAYLQAGMGVSGVNFAVAESGSIAIVSNEGNVSLGTSAPRLHVALMGLERIVPTRADLALMLSVLARSATGQKSTVYTDVITGPRRPGEPDGPEELHVVVVDNGRSRVLGEDAAEILACIRCGACLNACPVYREIGGHAYGAVYAGPIGAVLTPALAGHGRRSELAGASSLCGACREVCPVRIDFPKLLLAQRADAVAQGEGDPLLRSGLTAFRLAATRPRLYRLALAAARLATRVAGRGRWLRRLPGPLAGWTDSRDFPPFAARSFTEEWRQRREQS